MGVSLSRAGRYFLGTREGRDFVGGGFLDHAGRGFLMLHFLGERLEARWIGHAVRTSDLDRVLDQQPATLVTGHGALHEDKAAIGVRSEEHTSELQSLMRISYAVFCLNKKTN